MEGLKVVFGDKTYELRDENCTSFINDEEKPVEEISELDVLGLLMQGEGVNFDVAYYEEPCDDCGGGKRDKGKYYKFLEYHFDIFTLKGKYVVSNISKEYEGTSFSKLQKQGRVDNSYIVSVILCMECGNYSIEIYQE